jgi:hypothetical protein
VGNQYLWDDDDDDDWGGGGDGYFVYEVKPFWNQLINSKRCTIKLKNIHATLNNQ